MTSKIFGMVLCAVLVAAKASAVTLFSDNFNTNTSANWTINKAPTATDPNKQKAEFAFDYSAFGIPAPPGSSDTLGLRLRANVPVDANGNDVTTRPGGTISGLSVSPTGKDFGSNYILSFDAWANFFGSPNATGLADNVNSEGGTYTIMSVVGTSGTVPVVVANGAVGANSLVTDAQMDGIGLATTPDGGITNDFRIFPASGIFVDPGNPAYLAGGTSNGQSLYTTLFPPVSAPAIQQSLADAEFGSDAAPVMAGSTQAGSFGFAWHHVVITVNDGNLTWVVNGTKLVDANIADIPLGGNNIAFGVSDVNATTARHPSLAFLIIDNVVVTDVSAGALGDFNEDGKVDAGDYVAWRKNTGGGALPNDDGAADQAARYALWRSNFGNPPGAGSGLGEAAVPEPSSLVLLVVSAAYCWLARRGS